METRRPGPNRLEVADSRLFFTRREDQKDARD
jgi:hypothetical protein